MNEPSANPWDYLGNMKNVSRASLANEADIANTFIASGYRLLQWIGIFGCIVTMIIAIIKFTSSSANVRAEAKSLFSKKIVLAFFIFTAAYCFGYIWGLFNNL